MERFTLDDESVFQMLVKSSQDTNLKLTEVARWPHERGREASGPPGRRPAAPDADR
jgi:hypothetical protein